MATTLQYPYFFLLPFLFVLFSAAPALNWSGSAFEAVVCRTGGVEAKVAGDSTCTTAGVNSTFEVRVGCRGLLCAEANMYRFYTVVILKVSGLKMTDAPVVPTSPPTPDLCIGISCMPWRNATSPKQLSFNSHGYSTVKTRSTNMEAFNGH